MEISISSKLFTHSRLKKLLANIEELSENDLKFNFRGIDAPIRQFDATVLVSIVGGVGAILGSLITGLLKVLENQKANKIIITTSNGTHIEVPVGTPPSKISEYIGAINKEELSNIIIE